MFYSLIDILVRIEYIALISQDCLEKKKKREKDTWL